MFLLYVSGSQLWWLIRTPWDAGEFLKSWLQGPKPIALKSLGDGTMVSWFFKFSRGFQSVSGLYFLHSLSFLGVQWLLRSLVLFWTAAHGYVTLPLATERILLFWLFLFLKFYSLKNFFSSVPCSIQDLSLLTKDQTRTLCSGSMEFWLLDHQGSPLAVFIEKGQALVSILFIVKMGLLYKWAPYGKSLVRVTWWSRWDLLLSNLQPVSAGMGWIPWAIVSLTSKRHECNQKVKQTRAKKMNSNTY